MKKPLFSDDEYYINDRGLFVFTSEYLLKRGYCCGNGCMECPYEYKNVVDSEKKKRLLAEQLKRKTHENK